MDMQIRKSELAIKYVTGSLTDKKKEELSLFLGNPERQKLFEKFFSLERLIDDVKELDRIRGQVDVEAAWERVSQRIFVAPDSDPTLSYSK